LTKIQTEYISIIFDDFPVKIPAREIQREESKQAKYSKYVIDWVIDLIDSGQLGLTKSARQSLFIRLSTTFGRSYVLPMCFLTPRLMSQRAERRLVKTISKVWS